MRLIRRRRKSAVAGSEELEELERMLEEKPTVKQRLRRWERSKGVQVFLWITMAVFVLYAIFAFLYTTVVVYASGRATSFLWFWPVTCVMALVAAAGLLLVLTGKLAQLRTAAVSLSILFWVMMLFFCGIGVRIYAAGRAVPQTNADYVVVLGAQVRGTVPSLVLSGRIRAAAEYLKENPEAIAIASGGQGSGESISEAEAIAQGLMRYGISEDRILLEDASTSTVENLRFSKKIIEERDGVNLSKEASADEAGAEKPDCRIVIVTNDFHIFRATKLANKMAAWDVSGCGAQEFYAVTIQYYVRECFGVVLEFFRGTL